VSPADLAALLATKLAEAREAWPGVELPEPVYAAHVERLLDPSVPIGEWIDDLHATDLYLACACARGDQTAARAFDGVVLAGLPAWVAHIDRSHAFAGEVRQVVLERLLVGSGGNPPRIAEYSGQGSLHKWARVAATRVALNLRRGHKREVDPEDHEIAKLIATPDPELDLIKRRYHQDFRAAFRAALSGLPAQTRQVLRLHLVDGLPLERIGQLHGVNKSSVSRWLAAGRAQLLEAVRAQLRARLGVDGAELDSLIGAVQSQLEISLGGLMSSCDA
jgi:RNA polymerase sigma-70 factor (ECF subfamily)